MCMGLRQVLLLQADMLGLHARTHVQSKGLRQGTVGCSEEQRGDAILVMASSVSAVL